MDESKAIGPEIKGLFETIKKQAIEYSKAFDFFEQTKRDIILKLQELDNFTENISKLLEEKVEFLENRFNDFVTSFQEKTAKIENVYQNLEQIESLKNELSKLHSDLKVKLLEVDNLMKTLENKVEMEFENYTQKTIQRIEEQTDSTLKVLEVKYALKFKSIDEKLSNIERNMLNLTVSQSRSSRAIYDDIDTLKENIQLIKQSFYEERQRIEGRLAEFSEELNKKFIRLDQILTNFEQQTEVTLQSKDETSEKLREEVRLLFQNINEFRAWKDKSDTKIKNLLIIVSVLFIIAIIIGFIK
jgi:predicted  nucleic acid-binding Zn-ribbon protein